MIDIHTTIAHIRARAIEAGAPDNCTITISATARTEQPLEWTVGICWFDQRSRAQAEVGIDPDIAHATQKALTKIKTDGFRPWTPESARQRVGGTVGT